MEIEDIVKLVSEIRQDLHKMQETLNEISRLQTGQTQADKNKTSLNEVSDSDRYNLSESARLLNIDRKTLRTHANNGLIRCIHSKANKRRMFTGLELKRYYKSV